MQSTLLTATINPTMPLNPTREFNLPFKMRQPKCGLFERTSLADSGTLIIRLEHAESLDFAGPEHVELPGFAGSQVAAEPR